MDIESMHQRLTSSGVFSRAEEITHAATGVQDGCSWIFEQFDAAYQSSSSEATSMEQQEYLKRLKEARATFEALVDAIDEARRDIGWAMQHLGERPPYSKHKPLPQDAYEMPILDAIFEMGGSGRARNVLNAVGEAMSDFLPMIDLNPVKSSGEPRWRKIAQWARYEMTLKGLLNSGTPRGVWELSGKGRSMVR